MFITIFTFGFHESDLLNLALQDEEPVVIQVDAFGPEQLGHLLELAAPPVDLVVGRVVLGGRPRNDELRVGHRTETVLLAVVVNDLLEVNLSNKKY